MANNLEDRLLTIAENAKARRSTHSRKDDSTSAPRSRNEQPPDEGQSQTRSIVEMEQLGLFRSAPLIPRNEYPTLLTRLPIFPPTHRSQQKRHLDNDNALFFETPFGTGRRHGPPLSIEDEDTLIVLLMLRDLKLNGRAESLPFPVTAPNPYRASGTCEVHTVTCTLSDIIEKKGISNGGASREWTLDSIKRLSATTLEINVRKHERYFGKLTKGTTIKLMDVVWDVYNEEGYILVQFTPIIAGWLENEYTYISWPVRKQLSDLGKALHRFLSSQPRCYKGDLISISKVIGYRGPIKNLKPRFRTVLDKLIALEWLKHYDFRGTGRREPISLETVR